MTAHPPWIQELVDTPASERTEVLMERIEADFRSWLQMTEADALPRDQSYFELGLNSLGAIEMQQRLEKQLGRRIDSSCIFNNPTITHLAHYLRANVVPEYFSSELTNPRALKNETNSEVGPGEVPEHLAAQRESLGDILDSLYEL